MTHLTVVPPPDDYDAARDSLHSWHDAVAGKRLEHIIAAAFQSYLQAVKTRPGLTVSGWCMREIVRQHPGVLDAIGGRR